MTSEDKKTKIDCSDRLRTAFSRMRLLSGVDRDDLQVIIETWEHLEKEVRADTDLMLAMQSVPQYPNWREW